MTAWAWAGLAAALVLVPSPPRDARRLTVLHEAGRLAAIGARRGRLRMVSQGRAPSSSLATAGTVVVTAGVVAVVVFTGGPALGVAAGAVAVTVVRLARDGISRRRASRRRRDLAVAVRLLVAELEAGSRPAQTLSAAAEVAPEHAAAFARGAAAAAAGDDVAAALLIEADADLTAIAHAWRVADLAGAPAAEVLRRLGADLATAQSQRHEVATALAGARASAVLLSGLAAARPGPRRDDGCESYVVPVRVAGRAGRELRRRAARRRGPGVDAPVDAPRGAGTVVTGAVSWMLVAAALLSWPGGRRASARHQAAVDRRDVDGVGSGRLPAGVLHAAAAVSTAVVAVGTLGVTAGLTVTVVAVPGVVVLVARLAARPRARGPDLRLPLTLDLAAAAMRAGRPVDQALVLAAPTASGSVGRRLVQVAGLLRLGADPAEAWRVVAADDALAPVARTATRSASSGARLASALEDVAAELREQAGAEARARAQRAGTWAMLPLGLCFLPAFVCLGVVPVVVGIARGAMAGGP